MLIAYLDTKQSGLFKQTRVGQYGRHFKIYKIRTMIDLPNGDKKITHFGQFLRNNKWDELPQLFNILKGDMSFVGPRPDIPGYADTLSTENLIILKFKPGLTSVASLHFKEEETLLSQQEYPITYNDTVIWPQKVAFNKAYAENYSFLNDLRIIFKTLFSL